MTASSRADLKLEGSLTIEQAMETTWDTLIIGAGVAGTASAILAAQRGLRVLLVEAKSFPREKVCGGCLNQRAQDALQRLGVLENIRSAGSVELSELHVQVQRIGYTWQIPILQSVRRSTLDTILVRRAISMGVAFLPNTTATLDPTDCQIVRLRQSNCSDEPQRSSQAKNLARAKSVVVAAGLTRSAIKPPHDWPTKIQSDSRIGVQTLIDLELLLKSAPDLGHLIQRNPHQLHMLASQSGYAGVCLTDGGLVDIACAIDPGSVNSSHPIGETVKDILSDCGIPSALIFEDCDWMATPLLTRRSETVARPGVFLAGDSLGYVEPFTGEGMSWALDNAENLAPLLLRIVDAPAQRPDAQRDWERYVEGQRRFRQRICRWVAKQARHPVRSQWVLRTCQWLAPLRNRLLKEAVQ